MKKLGILTVAAALTGSLLTPALAAEPLLISPGSSNYTTTIAVNGTELDTSKLPASQGLPLRLIAEADYGSASWYAEENMSSFVLNGNLISVNFEKGTVALNGTALEDVAVEVTDGVTFLPVSVLSGLEGYTVDTNPELNVERIDITTPNNTPVAKLAYEVLEASGAAQGTKGTAEFFTNSGISTESFTEVVGFFPMIVSPDTVIVGKLADGQGEKATADLEAYRASQEATFSWYLPQNLPKVQNAKTVIKDGYFLFVIAENADQAVEAFETGVAALGQ